jgi:hypothetical protein
MKTNQIKTWKSFYNYLCPKSRQDKFHAKVYRKLFSIISRNRWVCEKLDDKSGVIVKHTFNDFKLHFKISKLESNASWSKIPKKLTFTHLESIGGLKLEYHWNLHEVQVKAIELSDGTIKMVNYRNLSDLLNGDKNVKTLYPSEKSLRNEYIKNNPQKFLKIENYFKDGTFVMVLEDCLWYKRGQVIRNYLGYSDFDWRYKKSPKDVLSEYCSITTTIECDLNLDLEMPIQKICSKSTFGCRQGCLNYCFAKSDNDAVKNLYNIMKKYKDML